MIRWDPATAKPVQTIVELWHNPRAVQAADGAEGVWPMASAVGPFALGPPLAETAQHQFDLANQPVER
jgi:hypothetical protein